MELVLETTEETKALYSNGTNGSSYSFNLFFPKDTCIPPNQTVLIDTNVKGHCKRLNTNIIIKSVNLYTTHPFLVIPNEWLQQTPLICKNMPILVETSNENIILSILNHSNSSYTIKKGMSFFKICCIEPINTVTIKLN
jgi:hypothetical protein